MAATVATYPLQVAQSLVYSSKCGDGMMTCLSSVGSFMLQNALGHYSLDVEFCMWQVWCTNGLRGLYKGMAAKLSQTVLNAALMFLFYEKLNLLILRALVPR